MKFSSLLKASAIALPSLISAWSLGGPQLNADTQLYAVMAHERLTLFYWGQNRLANLVATLVAPLGDIDRMLWTVLVLHALAWHGLLWLLAAATQLWAADRAKAPPVWLVYAALTALSHLLLTAEARYVFVAEGQPYALSTLAILAAWRLLGGPVGGDLPQAQSIPKQLLGLAALVAGLGLNPGALALLAALALAATLARQPRLPSAALVMLGALVTAGWQGAALAWGPEMAQPSYLALRTIQQKAHLAQALGNLWGALTQPWLALALGLLGAAALLRVGRREARALVASFALLALAWLALFATNRWVVVNHLHFKYFFPLFLLALGLWGWAAAAALGAWSAGGSPAGRRQRWGTAVLVAALAAAGLGAESRWTIAQFGSLAPAQQRLQQLPASPRPLLVGGNYWQVWPLVQRALAADRGAFGTAERGIAREGALRHLLDTPSESAKDAPWIAACVGAPEALCLADLQRLTARPWQLGPAHRCGDGCEWREARPGSPIWNCPPSLDFTSAEAIPAWVSAGLGPAEVHGRWTVGRRASLRCWWPQDQPAPRSLRLHVRGFLPSDRAIQRILPGDSPEPLATLSPQQPGASVDLPLTRAADGALEASWRLPDAVAPADLGLSGDERPLGVAVLRGEWVR